MSHDPVRAGVIGTGNMGTNHVRVYRELPETRLVGIYDADSERRQVVSEQYSVEALPLPTLLDEVDIASVAVPTEHHYDCVHSCIEAGVDVIVEKPFVESVRQGESLIEFAEAEDVTIQVGHIERFNPAVQELLRLHPSLDVVAVETRRLSPPPDRTIGASAVLDLMIHDIDLMLQLLDEPVHVSAAGTENGEFATATLETASGKIGRLTASRVTQEKVRKLTISAADRRVKVDFINQSLEICRQSAPEFVREGGTVNYHHESIVENLVVERTEPLKNEIEAFVSAIEDGRAPPVTATDGLRAVKLAQRIEGIVASPKQGGDVPSITHP